MSCFLLKEIGDQFCELLLQEKQAESHHLNEGIIFHTQRTHDRIYNIFFSFFSSIWHTY